MLGNIRHDRYAYCSTSMQGSLVTSPNIACESSPKITILGSTDFTEGGGAGRGGS